MELSITKDELITLIFQQASDNLYDLDAVKRLEYLVSQLKELLEKAELEKIS